MARPEVLAHRGDSFHAPENTLEAAHAAHAVGADAWEFDVRLTRDGHPIVIHDESLLRTTNVEDAFPTDPRRANGLRCRDFDLAEIRSLDAGSWFLLKGDTPRSAAWFGTREALHEPSARLFASGVVRVPTLDEALELIHALDWLAHVELKFEPGRWNELLTGTLAVIDRAGVSDRVAISSFDHRIVAEIARRRPDIVTGALIATPLASPARYLGEIVHTRALHAAAPIVDPSLCAELIEAGLRLNVYTVNDCSPGGRADQLRELGVHGIFTDDPGGLLRHWRS